MTPFNPDSWMDVFTLVALALIGAVPLWRRIKRIDDQVTNDHTDNMRVEITKGFKDIRADIQLLRDELHTERKERIEGDKRLENV